jgi:DNA-binding transcriptional ArsR family regulator
MSARSTAKKAHTRAGPTVSQPGDRHDLCEVRCIDAAKVTRARRAMKPDESVERVADTFKVLGDPTRLRIVHALAREELCVCDLGTLLGLSQSTISHSLRALRQMRLVRYRKDGKIAYYSLDDEHIARILGVAFEHAEEGA